MPIHLLQLFLVQHLQSSKPCEATLNTIHEKVKQEKLSSPAVIVVGEVVKLQKQIQKLEDTTCHLVTKIGDQPSKLAQILKDHGYKVKELQTGEISYRYDWISKEELAKVTYLIFTSRYGVHGFMKQMNLRIWIFEISSIKKLSL